jgi:hypothetical protein
MDLLCQFPVALQDRKPPQTRRRLASTLRSCRIEVDSGVIAAAESQQCMDPYKL